MKRLTLTVIILLSLALTTPAQKLLFEGDWQFFALRPSNLTGEKGISIFHDDDLQYSVGSASLNSSVVAETFNTNQGTLEFWVRPNWDSNDSGVYWIVNEISSSLFHQVRLYYENGTWSGHFNDGTLRLTTKTASHSIGDWIHVAVVWDGNNTVDGTNYELIYIDGVAGTGNANVLDITKLNTNFHIGHKFGSQQFNGLIAGRILNRAISADEVSDLYSSGNGSASSFVVDQSVVWMGVFEP